MILSLSEGAFSTYHIMGTSWFPLNYVPYIVGYMTYLYKVKQDTACSQIYHFHGIHTRVLAYRCNKYCNPIGPKQLDTLDLNLSFAQNSPKYIIYDRDHRDWWDLLASWQSMVWSTAIMIRAAFDSPTHILMNLISKLVVGGSQSTIQAESSKYY